MQIVIHGSVPAGKVTVNVDGRRVVLTRDEGGAWRAKPEGVLAGMVADATAELGEVLSLLSTEPAPDPPPTGGLQNGMHGGTLRIV